MFIDDIKPSAIPAVQELKFQEFEFNQPSKPGFATTGNDDSGFGLGVKPSWSNLNFYTKYFDVTTDDLKQRLAMAAMADATFLEKLNGRLDFYGPAWLSITIAVLLFTISSATKRIFSHAGEVIDLHLLTTGIVEMLFFTSFQTAFAWGFFRWRSIDGVKLGEMAALCGYSLTPLIPALLLCLIPLSLIQWAAFMAAVGVSGLFIQRNLWPILQTSPSIRREQAILFIGCLIAIHSLFILALRIMFFKHTHATPAGK